MNQTSHYSGLLSALAFERDLIEVMKRCGTPFSPPEFIRRVSDVYHELESENYEVRHPEIVGGEDERIRLFLKRIDLGDKETYPHINMLDIGCGTGYLTDIAIKELWQNNIDPHVVCLEPSKKMLELAKQRLGSYKNVDFFGEELDYKRIISRYANGFDLILTSSVLHHIPNIYAFGRSVAKLLSSGGVWLMLHEPSAHYYEHKLLPHLNKVYTQVQRYKGKLFRKLPVTKRASLNDTTKPGPHILDQVSKVLVSRKITPSSALTRGEIRGLIDIHTHNPHPGDFNIGYNGFDIVRLREIYFSYLLKLDYMDTYKHLGPINQTSFATKIAQKALEVCFPDDGLLFSAIWIKVH